MRNVLITGAGDGLGRVTAEIFAAAGDRVFACDIRAAALETLRSSGVAVMARATDVAETAQIDALFSEVWSLTERIDVLINNVGVAGPRASLENLTLEDWMYTLNANLTGALWMTRGVLPSMKQARSGVILNVTTASVRTLPEWRTPYVVSKAALESLTRMVAREVGPFEVRCNAVQPGLMDNARLERVLRRVAEQSGKSVAEVEREQLRFVSMRAKIAMREVADMLYYLASDAARHVTGQIIAVDGDVQWEG
jgi:NAD(P)-dependent dehydrogenase (short-subunit alcohol dehydrogenase family)